MSRECTGKKDVSAYVDNLLSAESAEWMRKHIEICDICRKELEVIQLTEKLFRELPEIEPSEDFAKTFWQKVDTLEKRKEKWSLSNLISGWRPYLVPSAAFAALLIMVTAYLPSMVAPDSEEIALAENIEFFETYPIVDQLELLENWDIIEQLEEKS